MSEKNIIQSALSGVVGEAKSLLEDPKNKQALAVAGLAYLLSRSNKERNALVAAAAALVLLPENSHGKK